jgi:integrase
MKAAPKTKRHIKAVIIACMKRQCYGEMVDPEEPMQLIEIKGISKRQKKPLILMVEQ